MIPSTSYRSQVGRPPPNATPGGPFGWWTRLSVPPAESFDMRNRAERELYRRAQLASAVIPVLILLGFFNLRAAIENTPTLIGVSLLFLNSIIAIFLNRARLITVAGILLVGSLLLTLTASAATVPEGLSLIWLPIFQIMGIAVAISGLLLPRWATFVTAGVTTALSFSIILFEPHAPDLQATIDRFGYTPILPRIAAEQWVIAILVFLLARSIERAIDRADRAEDLGRAEAMVAEQARYIADQNARLEFGIQQLLETHRRLAVGDFNVRTPTQQDNELWQIGVSLNNLINRFGRMASTERRLVETEDALNRLAAQIETARLGGSPTWPMPSGTAADQVLRALGVLTPQQWSTPRPNTPSGQSWSAPTPMNPPSQPWNGTPPARPDGFGGPNQSASPHPEPPWGTGHRE